MQVFGFQISLQIKNPSDTPLQKYLAILFRHKSHTIIYENDLSVIASATSERSFRLYLLVLPFVVEGQVALKAERHLLHAMVLDILVGCRYITVTCLVAGYHHTLLVGEVTDAGVLQAVELIAVAPFQFVAHHLPPLVEMVCTNLLLARQKVGAKDIAIVGAAKYLKFEH